MNRDPNYKPPTALQMMNYAEFHQRSLESLNQKKLEVEHFYLQLADMSANTFARVTLFWRSHPSQQQQMDRPRPAIVQAAQGLLHQRA